MVEPVAQRGFHQPRCLIAGQLLLGLALELRFAQEHRQLRRHGLQHVVGRYLSRPFVPALLPPGAQPLHQRVPATRLVRAAQRRGHRVAVGVQKPVAAIQPHRRPFDPAGALARQIGLTGPDLRQNPTTAVDVGFKAIAQATGEVQHGLGRGFVLDQARIAGPPNFHAPKQVSLRPTQLIQPSRPELQRPKNRHIRLEADGRTPPVMHRPGVDQLRQRLAQRIALLPQHPIPRDLDLHRLRQRVHDGAADAVQPARRLVRLAAKLPPAVQRGQNHLQRAQVLELGVGVHRDAAPVVADGQKIVRLQPDLDEAGVPRHRLVHRIVENFRRQMVHGVFVGAADVHAGPAADGLQPLQHLDVLRRVVAALRRRRPSGPNRLRRGFRRLAGWGLAGT